MGNVAGRDPGGSQQGPISFELLQKLLSAQNAPPTEEKKVRTPSCEVLRDAVDKHAALQWDPRMEELADCEVAVVKVDSSDGTTQVRSAGNQRREAMTAWLPSAILSDVIDEVRI